MKILITGAAGMLGTDIVLELSKNNYQLLSTDINQRLPYIQKLDVTEAGEIIKYAKEFRPNFIFHLAAETDVDLCQKNPEHAFKVNTLGTKNVALVCQELNIPLLYISTAGVFYGDKPTPYTESDAPRPMHIYGESKLQGEYAVSNLLTRYFIIRAGWMVGGWQIDKKFVYKIVKQIKDGAREIMAVSDKFGNPTFTVDFAKNLMNIINTKKYGLYHMANKGSCSRYDMALKIVEFMDLDGKVKVRPVSSERFPLAAPRARSEMLQNYKLDLLGLNNMPFWEESLENYIKLNKDK